MMKHPALDSVPRYPLSLILSYLQQPSFSQFGNIQTATHPLPHNRDALSLLLTCKRNAYSILPLFRVPKHACRNYQYKTKDGKCIAVIEKYRFVVLPIQDPRILLDRLNTRRLRGRMLWMKRKLEGTHHFGGCDEDSIEVECYQYGRTIEELAFEEWAMMQINHEMQIGGGNNQWRLWPAHLELLRFLDNDCNDEIQEQSVERNRKLNRKRRPIPSPFCFRSLNNKQMKDAVESQSIKSNTDFMGGQHSFGSGVSLLASYPRSGNTLLRTLLERITSIVTGSDTRPDRTLSKSLALDHDLVGEGLVGAPTNSTPTNLPKLQSSQYLRQIHQGAFDPSVHIVKTHFPERKGWKPVEGNRVLLLVRNPYDAIDSYWNLCCTNTHTRSLDESVYIKYAEKFEGLAKHEIKIWCDFHYYWIDICKEENVPLLIVRYEDLVLDVEAEMLRITKFLTGRQESEMEDDEDGMSSFWKWRIHHAIGKASTNEANTTKLTSEKKQATTTNTSNLGSYQPRSSSGGLLSIGKSIRKKRYSESVLLHMHDVAVSLELDRKQSLKNYKREKQQQQNKTLLQRFGYDIYNQQFPENFKQPPAISTPCNDCEEGNGTVTINKTLEIRSKADPYGRAMTPWRRGETDGDTNPFPTVAR